VLGEGSSPQLGSIGSWRGWSADPSERGGAGSGLVHLDRRGFISDAQQAWLPTAPCQLE